MRASCVFRGLCAQPSLPHRQSWLCQHIRLRPVSSCLLSTLRRRSSRLYDTFSSQPHLLLEVSQQPNPATQATLTEHWTKLVLSYARFRKLFTLRVEGAEVGEGDWDEVLRNLRINRKLPPSHLQYIISQMVAKDLAVYEPAKQTRSVLLYWRLPKEWAEVLYERAPSTGQLNTIMTFYEIAEPPIPQNFRTCRYHY